MNRTHLAIPALLLAGCLVGPAARAQTMLPGGAKNNTVAPVVNFDKGGPKTDKLAPPPALPGSQASPRSAAPASKTATEMLPNEALFDAINRGDVGSAREAIDRGADLGSRNVLGMTPLELSVDLNRNDISFLLLSLGGEGGSHASQQEAAAPPPARPAGTHREATRRAARGRGDAVAARAEREPAADVGAPAASPAARQAQLFAGDGGAPKPQSGFLGFDARR